MKQLVTFENFELLDQRIVKNEIARYGKKISGRIEGSMYSYGERFRAQDDDNKAVIIYSDSFVSIQFTSRNLKDLNEIYIDYSSHQLETSIDYHKTLDMMKKIFGLVDEQVDDRPTVAEPFAW